MGEFGFLTNNTISKVIQIVISVEICDKKPHFYKEFTFKMSKFIYNI